MVVGSETSPNFLSFSDYEKAMKVDESDQQSEIQDFYNGRSVFLTGSSGYVGEIVLEQLLRLCPGISEIFVLLREKKGHSPEKRLERTLSKPFFGKIREECPKSLEKVHCISGELTADGLGISPTDLERLQQSVSVVLHSAASVSFTRNISHMVMNNIIATQNIIILCRKLPKLVAFVHTSTAYCYGKKHIVEEEVPKFPISVEKIIEETRRGNIDFLNSLEKLQQETWYNSYTFTKAATERYVLENATDLPRIIVRPSIVTNVRKGSLPGFIEFGTIFSDVSYGILSGFIEVVLFDGKKQVDTIPVDVVANTLIISAWAVATKRVEECMVVNCTSSAKVCITWRDIFSQLDMHFYLSLNPNMFRVPNLIMVNQHMRYYFLLTIFHFIPALLLDLGLFITGDKPKFFKMYRNFDKGMRGARSFTDKEWKFKCKNFDRLNSIMNDKDQKIFDIDLNDYEPSYILRNMAANKYFQFKNDDPIVKFKALEAAERVRILMNVLKVIGVLLLLAFVWLFVKLLF